jgi:hypothetical protein
MLSVIVPASVAAGLALVAPAKLAPDGAAEKEGPLKTEELYEQAAFKA